VETVNANRAVVLPAQLGPAVVKPGLEGQQVEVAVAGKALVSDQNQVTAQDPWPEVMPFDPALVDVPAEVPAAPTAQAAPIGQEGQAAQAADAQVRLAGSKASWRAFHLAFKNNAKGWAKFKLAGTRVELRQRTTVLEQRISKFNQRINAFRGEAARARAAGNGQGAAALESLVTSAQVEVGALGRVRDQFGAEMSQIIGDERAMG